MRTRSVRMTDIKVGKTFRLLKGGERRRVTLKGGHENDVYILNPITHEVEYVSTIQAWDTTVLTDVLSGENIMEWEYDAENMLYTLSLLQYKWVLEAGNGYWWLYDEDKPDEICYKTKDYAYKDVEGAKLWANEIVMFKASH
jgi:hypothetical protein